RRLRAFVDGQETLRDGQIVRHLRTVHRGLEPLCLEAFRHSVLTKIRATLPLDDSSRAAKHALLIARSADGNRRPLRRLLKALAVGKRDYVTRHPASLAFLRRHPRLDDATWALWSNGIVRTEIFRGSEIRLAVEHDPLEILRMGTYVGSCLG